MTNQEHPLTCPNCGGQLKLNFEFYVAREGDLTLNIHDTPLWHCPDCEFQALHPKVEKAIQDGFRTLQAQGQTAGTCTGMPPVQQFPFETVVDFEYDSRDHYLFPGLIRPDGTGYLTPVIFKFKVLIRYVYDPDYSIDLVSESCGIIHYQNQWQIAFGINRSKNVILWLGDLAELPDDEQYYLKSCNITSDHDLASEFYDSQINLQFTEPSLERKLLKHRHDLIEKVRLQGIELYHLQMESIAAMQKIQRPLNWTEAEMQTTIIALFQVFDEALDGRVIKNDLRPIVDRNIMKGLNRHELLQLWFEKKFNLTDPFIVMQVLYNLRNGVYSHLIPANEREQILANCYQMLSLDVTNSTLEQLYLTLLEALNQLFTVMCAALDRANASAADSGTTD